MSDTAAADPAAVTGTGAPDASTGLEEPDGGPAFWVGLVLGWSVMAYAVWGAIQSFPADQQVELATWLLGSALAHDAVLAPVVTVAGLLLARVLPRSVRGPVLGALALSGIVVLFSWSALRGFGRRDANPSILPHDYTTNVTVVIAIVWAVALAVVVVRLARGRRS